MKVLVCGTGYHALSVEEVCLERGLTIVGYLEPESGERTAGSPNTGCGLSWTIVRRFYSMLSPKLQQLCSRAAGLVGWFGVGPPIPDGYIFPERVKGKQIVQIAGIKELDFDYVLIGHPSYERFRSHLLRQGVLPHRVLSLWNDDGRRLKKLGEEKYFLVRKRHMVDGTPERVYELAALQGLVTDHIASPVPLHDQYPLVERLILACKHALEAIEKAPSPYRPGFNWGLFLRDTRGNLLELIQKQRVAELTELLNECLRNRLTEGMYGGATAYSDWTQTPYAVRVARMKACYKAWTYTVNHDADIRALGMPAIGNPYGLKVDGATINANCFYNHYRAVFASKLLNAVEAPVVAEIGGGVGLFGYYFLKQTNTATYIDFDLPENLLVESYFLSMAFPEKKILYYGMVPLRLDADVLSEYDIVLMPNFMLPHLSDLSIDMFVNTISLSEMEYETISEYLSQIGRCCRHYFYTENLADFNFSYKNYPADFFPVPSAFREIMTAASRWPHFSFTSPEHYYVETLYERINADRRRKQKTPA